MPNRNNYRRWTRLTEESVKRWFDDINNEYPDRMQALEIIRDFHPDSLLEIGTGGGQDYRMFREYLPDCTYTGVDVSESIISELKLRYAEINMTKANFYNGLSFEDGSFDVVYARHVLEHCPYYHKPINEMLRLAKKAVVVVMYKPLTSKGKEARMYYADKNDNRYGKRKFINFLRSINADYELVPQVPKKSRDILVIRKANTDDD